MRLVAFACTAIFCITAWAEADQIEITGFVPGETTRAQIERLQHGQFLVIGGYKLFCQVDYLSEVLAKISCLTGKKWHSTDTTSDTTETVSNIEVHLALLKGFTKKLGNPTNVVESTIYNRLGTGVRRQSAEWLDRKGNRLTVSSMISTGGKVIEIDAGMLVLDSAQQIRNDERDAAKREQERKF